MTESSFEGKVVVVTGGSRGMGREMVRAFAARGAVIVIASRKLDACEQLAEEVRRQHGATALPLACNVSDWADCDRLVETVLAEYGRIDVLINNAGLSPLYASLPEVSESLFDKVIAVNLRGPFRLTALAATAMGEAGGGTVINIGSVEAVQPHDSAVPYAAAKAGLHALTLGFARSFGPKVRVNTIQAGAFLTDISQGWPDGMRADVEARAALGRAAESNEIVGTVLYLAGDSSSFTTGALIAVDGGWN